ncbi:MAG: diguanylate cyclase [Thermodesulfovibrionales bacterium]
MGGVFVLDLLTPLGYAEWLGYLVPLLFFPSSARRTYILFLPAVGTLLIVVGFFLSPPGVQPVIAVFNRCLGIGAVWAASLHVLHYRKTEERMREQERLLTLTAEKVSRELAREVEKRTAELDAERSFLKGVLMNIPAGVIIAEAPSGRLFLGNEQVERIWRHPFLRSENIESYKEYKGFHPDGRPYEPEEWPLARSILYGEIVCEEEIGILRGTAPRHVRVSSSPVRDKEERVIAGVVIFSDITEHKQNEEIIEYQTYHDLLTGLPNRMLFMDRLVLALAQAYRNKRKAAVLSLDIDRFKAINDALGHAGADLVLKEIAVRLRECVRESDTLARTGGDSFAGLLPEISHAEDAAKIAEKAMACLKGPCVVKGNELHVSACIGISIYPDDAENAEEMFKNADTALHYAKVQGRGSYQFFNDSLTARSLERISARKQPPPHPRNGGAGTPLSAPGESQHRADCLRGGPGPLAAPRAGTAQSPGIPSPG